MLLVEFIMGWALLAFIAAASSLYVLNRFVPRQSEKRIMTHCILGLLALPISILHFYIGINRGLRLVNLTSLGLVLVVVTTGTLMRFIPNAGSLRFHSSSLHPVMVLALLISVLSHILSRVNLT